MMPRFSPSHGHSKALSVAPGILTVRGAQGHAMRAVRGHAPPLLRLPVCVVLARKTRGWSKGVDMGEQPNPSRAARMPRYGPPARWPRGPTRPPPPPRTPPQPHLFGNPLALVVFIIAMVCGGWVLTHTQTHGPAASATATPRPTFPLGTATPAPVNAPTLGGTADIFTAAYGAEIGTRTWQSTIAGQAVKIVVDTLQPDHTTDGQLHIFVVDLTVPDHARGRETWNLQTANAIAATFFPSDALYLRDGPGAQRGEVDHIYHSDALAATFHAEVFTNAAGDKTDPPGTFHVEYYAYPPRAPNYGECYLSVGTQF
jgi:hypothetical protein